MKNKLIDLNDHLFAQMERLNDEDLSDDELNKEMQRAKSMSSIAKDIVSNARLALDAEVKRPEIQANRQLPAMLK